ncbi:hypothetical protein J3R82DRAFT_9209, partial [Butyriboletus roseoflavus]
CKVTNSQIFVIPAEHGTARRSLNAAEVADNACSAVCSSEYRSYELPEILELAIGMPVLITQNIHTELDITNGARGTVVDIVLNQAEPPPSRTHRVVDLLHPPAFVLV